MNTDAIMLCVLSSTVTATVLTSLKELWLWRLNRKAKLEDREEESRDERVDRQISEALKRLEKLDERIAASCNSSKVILQDKIKFLVLKYVEHGEISYEDRKFIHEMWNIYHHGLGGNGDLNDIMEMLDNLPIKR